MKILVDRDRCQGHGRCNLASPAIFDLDEEGFSVVLLPEVSGELAEEARHAVRNCPERAISATE